MGEEKYKLAAGYVQPMVVKAWKGEPLFLHHFSHPNYDSDKMILSDYIVESANPIVDDLNNGVITEAEAVRALDRIP